MTDRDLTCHTNTEKLIKQGVTFDLTQPLMFTLFKRAYSATALQMKVAHILDPLYVAKVYPDFATIAGLDPDPPGFTAIQWQAACRDTMRKAVERWPETQKKQEEEYGLLTAVIPFLKPF